MKSSSAQRCDVSREATAKLVVLGGGEPGTLLVFDLDGPKRFLQERLNGSDLHSRSTGLTALTDQPLARQQVAVIVDALRGTLSAHGVAETAPRRIDDRPGRFVVAEVEVGQRTSRQTEVAWTLREWLSRERITRNLLPNTNWGCRR